MISRLAIGLIPALAMAGAVVAQTPQAPAETPQQAKNREFIDCVREKRQPATHLGDAVKTMEIAETVLAQALLEGKR